MISVSRVRIPSSPPLFLGRVVLYIGSALPVFSTPPSVPLQSSFIATDARSGYGCHFGGPMEMGPDQNRHYRPLQIRKGSKLDRQSLGRHARDATKTDCFFGERMICSGLHGRPVPGLDSRPSLSSGLIILATGSPPKSLQHWSPVLKNTNRRLMPARHERALRETRPHETDSTPERGYGKTTIWPALTAICNSADTDPHHRRVSG